jgi:hypothetical protein
MARDGSRFAGLPFGHGSVCEQDLNAPLSGGFASTPDRRREGGDGDLITPRVKSSVRKTSVAAGFRLASASIVASAFSYPTPPTVTKKATAGKRVASRIR